MSATPLQRALGIWGQRDDFGGFHAVGTILFPGWEAKRSCKAPHRDDKAASFSVYQSESGWRFKDFAGGDHAQGGLVGFVMLAGLSDMAAARWLMEGAGVTGAGGAPDYTPRPIAARTPQPRQPYRMSAGELAACVAMAEDLLRDEKALQGIAKARGWKPETIRQLALDPCIGIHQRKLVCIYPTGAKKRNKPLSHDAAASFVGVPFQWMFGKPDELWRADHVSDATETVCICEGETAGISLIESGADNGSSKIVVAVAGASIWRDEWSPLFRGRAVVIWPDADDAGERLKERIVASLSRVARSIKIVGTEGARRA